MKTIYPYISPLIESQFPSFYKEEGPQFIKFVETYYEWLEQSNNVLYHTRKLLEYRDIDKTIDDFIVYFKEETLKNIQFNTATNKELLVKNTLDLYRSKGTPRAVELFFKLVYGQPARVYYPGDDLFKLSDNTWKIPEYLEVIPTVNNPEFEGKQITGLRSKATAFVENYAIKKKINKQFDSDGNEVKVSKDVHVFYITNVKGVFKYGETLIHSGTKDPRRGTRMIGSLNEVSVITGASNYQEGDVVKLISNTGFNGKAIVTSVQNVTGQVDFTLIDGGWGYSTSPKIIISEKALVVNNVIASTGRLQKHFTLFNSLIQPKAYIEFDSLTGSLQNNDIIYSYESSNVTSISRIVNISVNGSVGNMNLSIMSGVLPASGNVLYLAGNSSYANITLKTDKTSSANIMGVSSNNVLTINDFEAGINPIKGEVVYQQNTSLGEWVTGVISDLRREGSYTVITVSNTEGTFVSGQRLKGKTSGANANLTSYSTTIGIYDTSETSVISVQIENIGQGYSNGDLVSFQSTIGSGAVGKLITYANGSVANINLLNGGTGYIEPPIVKVVNTASPIYFNANTDVNETLDFITIANNGFINAQPIRYTANTGNTSLLNLISGFVYYARVANSTGIKLSENPLGNVIALTKGLSENGHSFTPVVSSGNGFVANCSLGSPFEYTNNLYVYSVTSNLISFNSSNVDATNNFITLGNHPFVNGQTLIYRVALGNTRINLLSNNSTYYVTSANSKGIKLAYANGITIPISPGSNENGHSFAAITSANLEIAGEGSLADIRVTSLDDEETVELNTDFISGYNIYGVPYLNIILNGSSNSALSGSNAYGFPAKPSGNLVNSTIASMLNKEFYTIGTISAIGTVNPGDDYTLDPFVTIIEPVIAGHRRYDKIMTIDGDTTRLTNNENILFAHRKAFDGSAANVISSFIYMNDHPFVNNQTIIYSTETGSSLLSGLSNNTSYYIVSANSTVFGLSIEANGAKIALAPSASYSKHYIYDENYQKFGVITKIVNTNTIEVKRLTMFNDPDAGAQVILKGESSLYSALLLNSIDNDSFSGLNSAVEANVVIANGSVKTLDVIDSGYAYEQNDIMSFQKEDDINSTIGIVRGRNISQGFGSGFYKNTKGFLSQDKYLHDNDFYQEYSYQILSRLSFETYFEMLKKVLHVAGTKAFGGVELEAKKSVKINGSRKLEIKTVFNPSLNVDTTNDFIRIPNHKFANGDMVTYSVDDGNTEIKTTSAINGIKTISVVTPGSYYNSAVNNQLAITGSDGNGAIAIFVSNSSGNITSVQVLNYGSGYTTIVEPTITAGITNALSTGATFTVSSYTGIGNNANYYIAQANTTGFKLSRTANGSSIINLVTPLPNEVGHGIYKTV